MRRFVLLGLLAAISTSASGAPSTPAPAPRIAMSPAIQQDVRCFMLFAAAVGQATKANDDKSREASSLGVMYFLGKLTVEAPTLNLVGAVKQEGDGMQGNAQAQAIGAACDSEFTKKGKDLIEFGQQLQKAVSQSSSSS